MQQNGLSVDPLRLYRAGHHRRLLALQTVEDAERARGRLQEGAQVVSEKFRCCLAKADRQIDEALTEFGDNRLLESLKEKSKTNHSKNLPRVEVKISTKNATRGKEESLFFSSATIL